MRKKKEDEILGERKAMLPPIVNPLVSRFQVENEILTSENESPSSSSIGKSERREGETERVQLKHCEEIKVDNPNEAIGKSGEEEMVVPKVHFYSQFIRGASALSKPDPS